MRLECGLNGYECNRPTSHDLLVLWGQFFIAYLQKHLLSLCWNRYRLPRILNTLIEHNYSDWIPYHESDYEEGRLFRCCPKVGTSIWKILSVRWYFADQKRRLLVWIYDGYLNVCLATTSMKNKIFHQEVHLSWHNLKAIRSLLKSLTWGYFKCTGRIGTSIIESSLSMKFEASTDMFESTYPRSLQDRRIMDAAEILNMHALRFYFHISIVCINRSWFETFLKLVELVMHSQQLYDNQYHCAF